MSDAPPRARWFVRGDLDGFFGLAIDNLVQLLLIDALCTKVLGFPSSLVHGRILPGAAVSILVGNLYYSWQARRRKTLASMPMSSPRSRRGGSVTVTTDRRK